ncbi:hypothetical protein [Nitratireductor luteus]|uniref:hypothetical protein n=1 Tax=Nitratireductor luteus TaxID=2976980 RepID=UPI00223F9B88|nr:hypothetical protein [Nitratireductor luteus]
MDVLGEIERLNGAAWTQCVDRRSPQAAGFRHRHVFLKAIYPRCFGPVNNGSHQAMEPIMIPFHLIFLTVLAMTVLSGAAATVVAFLGDTRSNRAQRRLVEILCQIALLGAGAIIALLARAVNAG